CVVVPVKSIRAISERFANTAYGFFLGKRVAYPVVANYVRNNWVIENGPWSSYARTLIDVRADVELKNNIVVAMSKLVEEGFYTCTIRVEYGWKPPRCACCKIFGHVQDECPKIIDSDLVKNMKKPSYATRGVLVGPKVGFQPVKQVYRQVFKKTMSTLVVKRKKYVEPTIEFVIQTHLLCLIRLKMMLIWVQMVGIQIWLVKRPILVDPRSGMWNLVALVLPLLLKKLKMERLIIDGKGILMDKGKPLTKVDPLDDHDSEDEVASVDNDMANFLASKKVGYGTNNLLEQWKESYRNDDHDFDPYDDDMYLVLSFELRDELKDVDGFWTVLDYILEGSYSMENVIVVGFWMDGS
ncbi:hypothetical protein Tco_0804066, partial [Tanacetum coccineum]